MNTHTRFNLQSLARLLVLVFFSQLTGCQSYATPQVGVSVGVNMFYDALAPYGTWTNHATYGQVWYPNGMAAGWRPYADGHWARTQNYGWLWVSDYDWGWAPFHYGRWAWDNSYGWLWVPGNTWAPAWVLWRYGGGYNAWAAMPPTLVWQYNGLNNRYFDYNRDLSWNSWVMVSDYNFMQPSLGGYIFPSYLNATFIPQTTYIYNNITYVNNTIVNHGVPVHHIEQATGRPIKPINPALHYGGGKPNDHQIQLLHPSNQALFDSVRKEEAIAQRVQAMQQHTLQQQQIRQEQLHGNAEQMQQQRQLDMQQQETIRQQQVQQIQQQRQLDMQRQQDAVRQQQQRQLDMQRQQDVMRQQQMQQMQQQEMLRQQQIQQIQQPQQQAPQRGKHKNAN